MAPLCNSTTLTAVISHFDRNIKSHNLIICTVLVQKRFSFLNMRRKECCCWIRTPVALGRTSLFVFSGKKKKNFLNRPAPTRANPPPRRSRTQEFYDLFSFFILSWECHFSICDTTRVPPSSTPNARDFVRGTFHSWFGAICGPQQCGELPCHGERHTQENKNNNNFLHVQTITAISFHFQTLAQKKTNSAAVALLYIFSKNNICCFFF